MIDHDKVAALNPNWSVSEWCSYWHKDARKQFKKLGYDYDELIRQDSIRPIPCVDCGEGCICKGLYGRPRHSGS